MTTIAQPTAQVLDAEWLPLAGGELEAPRPKTMCSACRARLQQRANGRVQPEPASARRRQAAVPLCFACHRADLERERKLEAAAQIDTASTDRFQFVLPLPPVNQARLARLKVERRHARVEQARVSPYVDRRRRAQLTAQHVLQRLAQGLRTRGVQVPAERVSIAAGSRRVVLPDSWLPFAASR